MSGDADVERALRSLRGFLPTGAVGVVLGSGMGGFAATLGEAETRRYSEIDGFPRTRVDGHRGVVHTALVGSLPVVVFEGRVHLYEGAAVEEVTFVARLLAGLNARAILFTTAAGGVGQSLSPGDLVAVTDHVNLTGVDPAREIPFAERDPPFPDRSGVYHKELLDGLIAVAASHKLELKRGILGGVLGPSYETPAEVRALRAIGVDVVCMSTVVEALAASGLGLAVAAIALVTNDAGAEDGTSHEEVLRAASGAGTRLGRLLEAALRELDWVL